MAKGYWVSFYEEILDTDKLAAYAELAGPAAQAAGGTFVVRGGQSEAREGMAVNRTVVVEFESYAAAQAAYDSAGYQAALEKLKGGVKRHFRITEGM
jgi:uncharacterized protein (DUF1330 family)